MVPDRLHADGTSTSRLDGYEQLHREYSEKTIFMKHEGKHFIVHGLFVHDMMHIATNSKLKNEFMEKYSRDFIITRAGFVRIFLGMEIEQSNRLIKLHLDHYVCRMLTEYKTYIKKSL